MNNKLADNTTYTKEKNNTKRNKNKNDNTPYDDVGKTMLHDCPAFVIPLVNEIFGENYALTDEVEFLGEENHLHVDGGDTQKGLRDFNIKITGEKTGVYHIEVQSRVDGTIVLRMFEYDIGYALENSVIKGDRLIVMIEKSAIIYLKHNKNTPDVYIVEIRTPGGNIAYEMPVMKLWNYTLNDIFEKKLLFLLPFYLFCYVNDLEKIEQDEGKIQNLMNKYMRIKKELEVLQERGELTIYEKYMIINMTKRVVRNLAKKYQKIQEGVNGIMGGRVLMHEAKALTEKGIKIGIEMERKNTEEERKRAEAEKKRADEKSQENKMLREILDMHGISLAF